MSTVSQPIKDVVVFVVVFVFVGPVLVGDVNVVIVVVDPRDLPFMFG